MHAIQEWINNHLIEWGIISSSANELDNTKRSPSSCCKSDDYQQFGK